MVIYACIRKRMQKPNVATIGVEKEVFIHSSELLPEKYEQIFYAFFNAKCKKRLCGFICNFRV